jgi:hypothetical protein
LKKRIANTPLISTITLLLPVLERVKLPGSGQIFCDILCYDAKE